MAYHNDAYSEWGRIPVDDFGYFHVDELMLLAPGQLYELINMAYNIRYSTRQWRNRDDCLTKFMNLDHIAGKVVMDYGCGIGLDSVKFTKAEATVIITDIHPRGLFIAQQAMCMMTSHIPLHLAISLFQPPWFILPSNIKLDMFWSLGVPHHIPYMSEILKRACEVLQPDGEIRILLYSDKLWAETVGEPMPTGHITAHPKFNQFVKAHDPVGTYADCFNQEKLTAFIQDFAVIKECSYISDGKFLAAVIKPR